MNTAGIRPYLAECRWIIGGLLYGLSFPSHHFSWLSFLALAALAPTLFSVIEEERFSRFFAKTCVSFFIGCSTAIWWAYPTHYLASLCGHAALALCISVPVLLFFPIKKRIGTGFALLLLPFIWAAWEWIFSFMPFCIPLVFFGHTQAVHPALIQYASITGVWGVSFWLVACNALLVAAVRGYFSRPGRFIYGVWKVAALLLLPPVYSCYEYYDHAGKNSGQGISIMLVQPNIKWLEAADAKANDLNRLTALTTQGRPSQADLIIWPEGAVQFPLFQLAATRDFISNEVRGWDTPLFTGMFASKRASDETLPSGLPSRRKRLQHFNHYNAAMMITPELASYIGQGRQVEPTIYYKRKLFPFVEFIPFVGQFPFLAKLQLPLTATSHNFSLGEQPETFVFKNRGGDKVRMGALICFEEFYPGLGAELAAGGARFIAIIGDEWQFRPEAAHYFNMVVSGMRAIETGLPLVRNADNGFLAVTDPRGVTTQIAGAQSSTTAVAAILPSSGGNTFFTLHQNGFPLLCVVIAGALLLGLTVLRSTAIIPEIALGKERYNISKE